MKEWYLAYTKPKSEDNVAYRLTGAGFDVLNPKIKERRYCRRKMTDSISALFPCYLFVKFDSSTDYHLIRYTRGIKRVLMNDNGPAAVPQEIIDSITKRLTDGCVTIRPSFTPGQTVVIKGGPFEGLDAVFEKEMKSIERVSVLLRAINVRVVVDGRMLANG